MAYNTGASSGNLILLSHQIASGAASLTFTSLITNAYDQFLLRWYGQTVSGTNVVVVCQYSTNNGSTWETTNYRNTGAATTQVSHFGNNTTSAPGIALSFFSNTSAVYYAGGEIRFDLLHDSTFYKSSLAREYEFQSGGGGWTWSDNAGIWEQATAVNAIRIIPSTGTISGHYKLFAIQN